MGAEIWADLGEAKHRFGDPVGCEAEFHIGSTGAAVVSDLEPALAGYCDFPRPYPTHRYAEWLGVFASDPAGCGGCGGAELVAPRYDLLEFYDSPVVRFGDTDVGHGYPEDGGGFLGGYHGVTRRQFDRVPR